MDEQEQQNVVNDEQQDINQVEPTSVSSPPSHKKLIIGIVAVFVLVVAGIAGAYFVLQSKSQPVEDIQQVTSADDIDETDGWKTYRNENFGFEFKYPQYFDSVVYRNGNLMFLYPVDHLSKEYTSNKDRYGLLSIDVDPNPNNYDFERYYVDSYDGKNHYLDTQEFQIENSTIQGRDVITITSLDSTDRLRIKITVPFGFISIYDSARYFTNQKLLEKMLATFQFFEPKPLYLDTLDWKTHRNEEYNFEIKYPPAWNVSKVESESATNLYHIKLADTSSAVEVFIETNAEKLSLFSWHKSWHTPKRSQGIDIEYVVISGSPAMLVNTSRMFVEKDDYVYGIQWNFPELFSKAPEEFCPRRATGCDEEVSTIISTFKFIE